MSRYSKEQQAQIIKMKSEGITSRNIAKKLGLSKSGVNDFYNRLPSLFAKEHKESFETDLDSYLKERNKMYERADENLIKMFSECNNGQENTNNERLCESVNNITPMQRALLVQPTVPLVNYGSGEATFGAYGREARKEATIPLIKNHTDDCRNSYTINVEPFAKCSDIMREVGTVMKSNISDLILGHKHGKLTEDKRITGMKYDMCWADDLEHEGQEKKLMKIVTSPLRSGNKTHMYIPDSQVKPDILFEYLRCKGEYILDKKPDVIVFAGDFADMPSLSSYDKGKGKAEGKRVKKDIEAAIEGMQTLLKPLYDYQQKQLKDFGFIGYKPRMLITLGNHEDRINRYTNDNPELIDFISIDSLKYKEQGLEVYDFLEPVLVDGITYIHYLPNEFTGKPQGGTAAKILADFGGSITQGHKQTLAVATRFAPATGQQTWYLQAGACYDHHEAYKGLYNNNHFRGLFMKYNLDGKGNYDLHTVSLKYIMDKYSWT